MRAWALILLAGCEWPALSLASRAVDGSVGDAVAADASDDDDDDLVPCATAAACPPAREPDRVLCNLTVGYCVECISDADCPAGETCEPDGDCDD